MQQTGMYNMDESSLTSVQRHGRVISVKGKKVGGMTRVVGGARRLECCSRTESGRYIPPMVIFKRKRMLNALKEGAPPDRLIASNDIGWLKHLLGNTSTHMFSHERRTQS